MKENPLCRGQVSQTGKLNHSNPEFWHFQKKFGRFKPENFQTEIKWRSGGCSPLAPRSRHIYRFFLDESGDYLPAHTTTTCKADLVSASIQDKASVLKAYNIIPF